MLIGESKPISGDIFINGKNINQIVKYRREFTVLRYLVLLFQKEAIDIGYCPQFNWLIDNLIVTETITLFARYIHA